MYYNQEQIIEPRMNAVNNREEKEAFDLDIVEYQDAYQTESYFQRPCTGILEAKRLPVPRE